MLIAPSVIGVTAEQVGFAAIFIALSGLLLSIAALAPVLTVAPDATTQAKSQTQKA
jgi:hypothetical protein